MPINHPYDPRYNAKIYVPKLTEAQRRARATPLENLRSLRFRSEMPVAPSVAAVSSPAPSQNESAPPPPSVDVIPKSAAEAAPTISSTPEAVVPAPVQVNLVPTPKHIPTAREVLFAEFPEFFPLPYQEVNGEVHVEENSIINDACLLVGNDWKAPHKSKIDVRLQHPERRPRSTQRQQCQTFSEPSSSEQNGRRQAGNQTRIVNSKRARLPGLILAIP